MGKFRNLSPELWSLIDIILCSYIELIFCGVIMLACSAFILPWANSADPEEPSYQGLHCLLSHLGHFV